MDSRRRLVAWRSTRRAPWCGEAIVVAHRGVGAEAIASRAI